MLLCLLLFPFKRLLLVISVLLGLLRGCCQSSGYEMEIFFQRNKQALVRSLQGCDCGQSIVLPKEEVTEEEPELAHLPPALKFKFALIMPSIDKAIGSYCKVHTLPVLQMV